MTNVSIIYDDDWNDVDIIAVPDELAFQIEDIGQDFLDWVPPETDSDYYIITDDGEKIRVSETDGFIKWLNNYYCLNTEKAHIVASHTKYCPKLKKIEF